MNTSYALIAAMSRNRVIGRGDDIPWVAKGEQALFKKITSGGTVIMGRKTFDSIGRPLPKRHNIVITRKPRGNTDQLDFARAWKPRSNLLPALLDLFLSLVAARSTREPSITPQPFTSPLSISTLRATCTSPLLMRQHSTSLIPSILKPI